MSENHHKSLEKLEEKLRSLIDLKYQSSDTEAMIGIQREIESLQIQIVDLKSNL